MEVDVLDFLDRLDTNGSDEIDYTEFISASLDEKYYREEGICWTAFRYFDRDGNGVISASELQEVLADGGVESLGLSLDLSSVNRVLKEVDTNGDQEIDF